jgi:hypothetical protein
MADSFWLSVFRLRSEGMWDWLRLDPRSGEERHIATLETKRRPWPPDAHVQRGGAEALVVVRGPDARVERLRLDGIDGSARLPLPESGCEFVLNAGYDEAGRPVVFYGDRDRLERVEEAGKTYVVVDGERHEFHLGAERTGQMRNVLATVVRLEDGAWQRIERRVVLQWQPNYLTGLETARLVSWPSFDLREGSTEITHQTEGAREWFKAWRGPDEYLSWYRCDRGSRAVRFRAYSESAGIAIPIVVEADAGWTALAQWAGYQYTFNRLRGEILGDFLLLTDYSVTRLHDLRDASLVWEAPKDDVVGIWPELAPPEWNTLPPGTPRT